MSYTAKILQIEIAKKLGVSQATVSRDIKHVKEEIHSQRVDWGDEQVIEHRKYLTGIGLLVKSLFEKMEEENLNLSDTVRISSLIMKALSEHRKAKAEEHSVLDRRNYLNRITHTENQEYMKKDKRKTEFEGKSNSDIDLPNSNFKI